MSETDYATICKLPNGHWRTIWRHDGTTDTAEAPNKRKAKKPIRALGFIGTFHKVKKDELSPRVGEIVLRDIRDLLPAG